jgi:hypothetical protein
MLLTISSRANPATDLGYLLHKNPTRIHRFDLSFGRARVFYTEATFELCTVCLMAIREFALGVEGLDRFVHGEPLRRVHECVSGVLAMESERVDPLL